MDAPPYRTRLLTFLSLREELRARCPRAEWFDLRFRDRIYVMQPPEPAQPAPVADPAASGAGPDPSTVETAPRPIPVSQVVAVPVAGEVPER